MIVGFTTEILNTTLIIIILVTSGIVLIAVLFGILLLTILCVIKTKCVATKTSENDLYTWNKEPTYEEVSDTHHKGMQMEGNAAYGHMIHASQNDHHEYLHH